MSGRGMMMYLPYKSLIDQESSLAKILKKKKKIDKPLIASEEAEQIDLILRNYNKEEVIVSYWLDGYIYKESGVIFRIDATFKYLLINGIKVPFKNLVGLSLIEPSYHF